MKKSFYIAIALSAAGLLGANNAWADECVESSSDSNKQIKCYDANGNMISHRYYLKIGGNTYLSTMRVYTYDANGRVITEKKYNQEPTKDQLSNDQSAINSRILDVSIVNTYDNQGNLVSKKAEYPKIPQSGRLINYYDDHGTLVSSSFYEKRDGEETLRFIEEDGKVYANAQGSASTAPSGVTYFIPRPGPMQYNWSSWYGTSFSYNYSTIDPSGGYFVEGNKIVGKMSCNAQNNCTTEFYDENGRVTAKYDADGNPTEAYDYDDEGNKAVYNSQCEMIALYDPEGNILPLEDDTTDEEGLLVDDQPSHQTRRIYTVQEAKDALGTMNKNTFSIRYR